MTFKLNQLILFISTCHRQEITTEIQMKEQIKFDKLFFRVTEINRNGCYCKNPYFAREFEEYRD